ncbi:MFS transporter [Nocardiopsis coralliicola]
MADNDTARAPLGAVPPPDATARPGWLLCLLAAAFVIGTDDFLVAGLLPEIAGDLRVGEGAAGQLVTVFSLTYAAAAPAAAVLTARLPRRRVLISGMLLFAAANAAVLAAPGYAAVLGLRVLAAASAAAVTPALFGTAERLSAPERTGRAIAAVGAGLTIALLAGVPAGTLIGGAFGWRAAFGAVALAALAVAAGLALLLPPLPAPPGASGTAARLRILAQPAVLSCAAGTAVGATGGLLTFTYIAPIVRDLSGAGGPALAGFIALAGAAAAAGTFAGGAATDRWGADRALLAAFGVLLAATLGLLGIGLAGGGAAPAGAVAAVLAVWGFGGWAFNPPMNTRALRLAGDAGTEAVALTTSALYIGVAAAGALGGAAVAYGGGVAALAVAGTAVVAALGVMAVSVHRYPAASGRGSGD